MDKLKTFLKYLGIVLGFIVLVLLIQIIGNLLIEYIFPD